MGQLEQAEDPDWPGDQEKIKKTTKKQPQQTNNQIKNNNRKRLVNSYMSYNYDWVAWDLTYSFGKGRQNGMCKLLASKLLRITDQR